MSVKLSHTDGIEASITLKFSKPVSGLRIIAALLQIEKDAAVLIPKEGCVLLGGKTEYHPDEYALLCPPGDLVIPDTKYTEVRLVHCNWPGMHFDMGYPDAEGRAMDNLKAKRNQLEEIFAPKPA